MPRYARYIVVAGAAALAAGSYWLALPEVPARAVVIGVDVSAEPAAVELATDAVPSASDDADVAIFRQKLAFARREGLFALGIGDIVARIGATFVATPYAPYTLEGPGPEDLVVNLRELDCVTFVESVLALSRLVRAGVSDFDAFRRELTAIRYRNGTIDGYPSRLHYFSEWIADNEARGTVRDVTRALGGVPLDEPIDFMSRNPGSYPKLAEPATLAQIREIEARLSGSVRYYVPQERIAEVAPAIRDGDIIAATSSVRGLDVAHTGIALWVDGELHLLHAPLVGTSVEISALPLAERIRGIRGQDGIMVARPL